MTRCHCADTEQSSTEEGMEKRWHLRRDGKVHQRCRSKLVWQT